MALTCCVALDQTVSPSVPHLSSQQDCLFLFPLGQELLTWVLYIWVGKIHPCSPHLSLKRTSRFHYEIGIMTLWQGLRHLSLLQYRPQTLLYGASYR